MLLPSCGDCCWLESHVLLLKSLVDLCPEAVSSQLDDVMCALQAAVQQQYLAQSATFGQLLLSMLKNFAGVMTGQQLQQLAATAGATNSFLTKSINSKVQRLLQGNAP